MRSSGKPSAVSLEAERASIGREDWAELMHIARDHGYARVPRETVEEMAYVLHNPACEAEHGIKRMSQAACDILAAYYARGHGFSGKSKLRALHARQRAILREGPST